MNKSNFERRSSEDSEEEDGEHCLYPRHARTHILYLTKGKAEIVIKRKRGGREKKRGIDRHIEGIRNGKNRLREIVSAKGKETYMEQENPASPLLPSQFH